MALQTPTRLEFTEDAIRTYLDKCIRFWRGLRDDPDANQERRLIASVYCDAFQSVRTSLFGFLLPMDDGASEIEAIKH